MSRLLELENELRGLRQDTLALEARLDVALTALRDIADRWTDDSAHIQWALGKLEPCTCIVHVARRALAAAEDKP